MRHRGRQLGERLDGAERLREGEHAQAAQRDLGSAAAVHVERENAAVAAVHLPLGELVSWMLRQARIMHVAHTLVLSEPAGHGERRVRLAGHPQLERLDAAQQQPAVERRWYGADRVLMKAD